MNEKLKRLLTPEGVRDLLPGLAGQKRGVESGIQETFSRWGYREVSTPVFEYSANFVGDMKADLEDRVYRILDERGRAMVLRPDFTLPLARVAATHLMGAARPLRLSYSGSIYRYAGGQQGKQREVAQAGVELIGSGCPGADGEVIALAAEALNTLGLQEFTLCLGHIGFLENLLAAHGVGAEDGEQIKGYFSKKDFVSLKEFVNTLKISDVAKESILRVPMLRGGKEALREAAELVPNGGAAEPLSVLEEVLDVLEDYGVTEFVTLDLGLVRMLDYYTGVVFEGYTGGLGYPICGGGRYDQLLEHFGPKMPAVGFALNIDHLLTVLQRNRLLPLTPETVYVAYGKKSRAEAMAAAQKLRRENVQVSVDVCPRSVEEAKAMAEAAGSTRLIYHNEGRVMERECTGKRGDAGC